MSTVSAPDVQSVSAASLGGPGPADAVRCAATAIAAMSQVAGRELRMTSLALELAGADIGEGKVGIHTSVDKRARSILFVSVVGKAAEQMVFTAQGLFSVPGTPK